MKDKIGFRIFKDFERPSKELVEKFRGLPSSNIGDMVNRLSCMRNELRPFNDKPLLGVAFTVKAPAGDNMILHKALHMAKPGDILVVDGEGCKDRSLIGEMMMDLMDRRGLAGLVVDGAIRDVDAIPRYNMAVYATAVTPQGPYKNGPGEINVPIACCGQVVFPGDIIVGDPDGIVAIRPEMAEEVFASVESKFAGEQKTLSNYAKGIFPDRAKHEAAYRKTAADSGCTFYDEAWK